MTMFRIEPRTYGDVQTIWVHGTAGDDANDGLSASRALRTAAGLASVFERMGNDMERGLWRIRLSGTITGGFVFTQLPTHRARLLFEGDPLDANGRPTTWIVSTGSSADRFGMRIEPGEGCNIALTNLGFRDFDSNSGYGWLQKEGGFIRATDCWTENCQIGSGYVGRVGFSEIRGKHRGFTISGSRAQHNASGSWTNCDASGGNSEGFHVSRGATVQVSDCIANDNSRDGVWANDYSRASVDGGQFWRNGREGVRGEGTAEVHLDDTTNGPIDFGVGTANANSRRGVGLYGDARHTATQSVYGVRDIVVDRKVGSYAAETKVTSDRGLRADRIGNGSRLRILAWGTGAGQVSMALGSSSAGTFDVPQTWEVEAICQYLDGVWKVKRTVLGGATVGLSFFDVTRAALETIPSVTPRTGSTLLGVEFSIGG